MNKYKSEKEDIELVMAQRQEEIDALGDDINSINYDIQRSAGEAGRPGERYGTDRESGGRGRGSC